MRLQHLPLSVRYPNRKGRVIMKHLKNINEAYLCRARRKPEMDRELLIDRFLRNKNYF